jgi:DUF971 family protein
MARQILGETWLPDYVAAPTPAASSACWSDRFRRAGIHSFDPRFSQPHPMSGLDRDTPLPAALTVHQASRVLEIAFSDGAQFRIPFELMRVYSPSAEVQGHGPGQEVLQTGKRGVGIDDLQAVGHYAVQPRFSDGHDSGIFSWDYLYHLGRDEAELWQRYEQRLADAGMSRDAPMAPPAPAGGSCASH